MNNNHEDILYSYIESHYPILYISSFDESGVDDLLLRLANGRKIFEWNMADGVVDFNNKQPILDYSNLSSALDIFYKMELNNHFLVIKDAHIAFKESSVSVVRLKTLARKIMHDENTFATIILVSSQIYIPPELDKLITLLEFPLPTSENIKNIINGYANDYEISVSPKNMDDLVLAFRGLNKHEIIHLLNRDYQHDGELGGNDISMVLSEKEQIVRKSGILEMIHVTERLEDIGGLNSLKHWLKQKAKVLENLSEALGFGVEPPKGMMIVGMPGCGKSLTAKAAAALFEQPLLRLDVGSLMGKYVGESESNMRRALSLAEAVSPCVLWVDEIEKAFVGIGGGDKGSEVASRLFGYFLSWLQDKSAAVFVLATANDLSGLPPELMRKGRFDEIFYVDFPNDQEREEIFRIHLERRNHLSEAIHLPTLARETRPSSDWVELQQNLSKYILENETNLNGGASYGNSNNLDSLFPDLIENNRFKKSVFTGCYTGADIESIVNQAIEEAFIDSRSSLNTARIVQVIKNTESLGEVMSEHVASYMYKFLKMKLKRAS